MKRQSPSEGNENLELYVRTYYSLLKSSGEVRVRAVPRCCMRETTSCPT